MPEIQAQSESPAHTGQGANAPEWPRGEVAFVTGAASGIGLGISRALVRAGARVALADIDQSRLDAAAEALRDEGGSSRRSGSTSATPGRGRRPPMRPKQNSGR